MPRDTLECLADLAGDGGSAREAARLFGAADAIRQRIGEVRFKIYDAGYEASVTALHDALGEKEFEIPHGPRAPPCLPRRRLPTPSAAAANVNASPAGGRRSPRPSATSSASSAKDSATRTSPHGCSFTAHRANPPHSRLHQTSSHLAGATRPRNSPPRLNSPTGSGTTSGRGAIKNCRPGTAGAVVAITPFPARGAQTRCSSGPTNRRLESLIA